jgi:prefoldin subunit 5
MSKEQALEIEKKQKEELESLIAQMEKKLVHGGHGMDDLSEQKKEQITKERML